MSTLQSTPRVPYRLRTRLGAGLVALGALIAIAVSVLILALTGANHTTTASSATHNAAAHVSVPVTQSHGTGAPHAVLDPLTGQMHGGGVFPAARGAEPILAPRPYEGHF